MTDLNPDTRKQAYEVAMRYATELQCTLYIHRSAPRGQYARYHIGPEPRIRRATLIATIQPY